jgi:hypothetical protein
MLCFPQVGQIRPARTKGKQMKDSNKAAALVILNQQKGTKKWGATEHLYMIANIVAEVVEAEQGAMTPDEKRDLKKAIRARLEDDGVAGNSSQFRQALVKAELLTATETKVVEGYEDDAPAAPAPASSPAPSTPPTPGPATPPAQPPTPPAKPDGKSK